MRIILPEQLLPCIDDSDRLAIIADFVEEDGDAGLARYLRKTAKDWLANRGIRRCLLKVGQPVWARYQSSGWSRAVIERITPRMIVVEFPHRTRCIVSGELKRAERAWWELEPRTGWDESGKWIKPKPCIGYATTKNAALARALTFDRQYEQYRRNYLDRSTQATFF